jgi:hypothetical protein
MAVSIEVTRPDDLLRLRIEGRNLRVQRGGDSAPSLVVDDGQQPAFLVVHFAPQSIAESAYYEATIVNVDPDVPDDVPPPPPETVEPVPPPGGVPVRIAHNSRLVFRVPAGREIPLTIDGLLDWSDLELSVSPIAAIGPSPTAAEIAGAPAIARPADTETALELPYKLVVSPTAGVRWGHRRAPFTARGRTELWHTRMQWPGEAGPEELSPRQPASLRAIWSEDYNTRDGRDPNADDPQLHRAAMTPNDRHQIVVKTSAFHGFENEITVVLGGGLGPVLGGPILAGPAPGGLPGLNAALTPALAASPRTGFALGAVSPLAAAGIALTYWVPFVPRPFYADQVMLSSLGGWLHSRGHWPVVRKARPRFQFEALALADLLRQFVRNPRSGGGPAAPGHVAEAALVSPLAPFGLDLFQPASAEEGHLDLSEWVHVATQGRDHYVRIVYEGELLPYRNRAALVKVTERKFKEQGGLIVAQLFQRNFIVVREPEKRFADDDFGMIFKKVLLTTTVTPDIASPAFIGPRSFWVEVMTSTTTRVRLPFHALGTDAGAGELDFTIPMLFLSDSAQGAARQAVIDAYNDSSTIKAMADRSATVPGHKILFAPRDAAAPADNARLVTRTLTFALRNGAPQLLKADVNVPQVQEVLGIDAPTTIRLYPPYVTSGPDAGSGVFAEIVNQTPAAGDPFKAVSPSTLGVNFSSDQAGGFATPNMSVSTLSRKRGPLAGTAAQAVSDTFDPASFFPAGTATLFGTFDLFDLLLGATLDEGAPKLQTDAQDVPGGKLIVATLDWLPKVRPDLQLPPGADPPIAEFRQNGATKLVVHGRIEKPVTFDASGAPVPGTVTSLFTGTLNDFLVILLGVVEVRFTLFGFTARSGAKPDLTVALDPAKPIAFTGDLTFVEELRNAIPPDLFGDGPSLDLSPTGIRAGFSFALPPVAVGVFALKDVSLGAALTLPFLDGRPSLDFNVSERPHPFLLSVGIFGGGGFFHLQLDTAGLKIVEAAFEFGATASIDLGVASGGVHIMAGIYFKLERRDPGNDLAPTLTGYLRMGGYLSVLGLIKISLEFTLSFTYDGGRDKAYGRATLTVQVEIVFFSTSVEITVEKAFGGTSGDPAFGQLFPAADTWTEYAEAFA